MILIAALCLLPSAVWAHAGHAHHGPQVAAPVADNHHAGVSGQRDVAETHETVAAAPAEASVPERVFSALAVPRAGHPSSDAGCVGGCCGVGAGCCPAAMAIAVDPPWVLPPAGRLRASRGAVRDLSADLEALPKPPKVLV